MIAQIWIALFGLTSAWLVYDRNERRRRWAPVLAFIAQPAWYWSCISAHQWGVLALTFFYTCLHIRGMWKLWVLNPAPALPAYTFTRDSDTGVGPGGVYSDGQYVPWQEREIKRKFTFVHDEHTGFAPLGRCPCGAKLVNDRCPRDKPSPSQLPKGMEHCTIQFTECEKGHGSLTANNWVKHLCPWCEIERLKQQQQQQQPPKEEWWL